MDGSIEARSAGRNATETQVSWLKGHPIP